MWEVLKDHFEMKDVFNYKGNLKFSFDNKKNEMGLSVDVNSLLLM
jgi:hypothetical protein